MLTQDRGTEAFTNFYNPRSPLHSPNLAKQGIWRSERTVALQDPFIEVTARTAQNSFVLDVDIQDAESHILSLAYDEGVIPAPNLIITNRATTHAHALFLIEGVATSQKGISYVGAIQRAMSRKVAGADEAYGNLIMRNPLHHQHLCRYETSTPQTLKTLASYLSEDDLRKANKRTHTSEEGYLGRNHCLFEILRHWAYRERKHHDNYNQWLSLLKLQIRVIQAEEYPDLANHLSLAETNGIAKSVANWTWNLKTDQFQKNQSWRGRKSGEARKAKAESEYAELLNMMELGLTNREIAELLRCSVGAVKMKKQRAVRWVEDITS